MMGDTCTDAPVALCCKSQIPGLACGPLSVARCAARVEPMFGAQALIPGGMPLASRSTCLRCGCQNPFAHESRSISYLTFHVPGAAGREVPI